MHCHSAGSWNSMQLKQEEMVCIQLLGLAKTFFFFWQFKIVIGLGFEQYPLHFKSGVKSLTLIVFSFS